MSKRKPQPVPMKFLAVDSDLQAALLRELRLGIAMRAERIDMLEMIGDSTAQLRRELSECELAIEFIEKSPAGYPT